MHRDLLRSVCTILNSLRGEDKLFLLLIFLILAMNARERALAYGSMTIIVEFLNRFQTKVMFAIVTTINMSKLYNKHENTQ